MAEATGFAAIRSALSHPNYARYTVGNVCSHLGTWVQRVAVGWLTWELTESGTWLGIIAFADLAPTVVLAPLAGAVADRVDRMKAIKVTQSLALLQAVALAALTFSGLITRELLLVLALSLGVVMAFNQPLRLSIVPGLVPRRDLSSAIGINSLSFNFARVGGPALAGIIIVTWGVAPAFAFNALSYLVFIAALFLMRVAPWRRPAAPKPLANIPLEIMEGFRYSVRHPGIGPLLVVLSAVALGGRAHVELLPGFAANVFGRGADGLAMLTSAMGVGAVAGGILLARRGAVAGLTTIVTANMVLLAVALAGFTATDMFWLALPCLALSGFGMVTIGVGEQTLMQNAVDGAMRGRVLSLYGMIARGGPAFGALVMGGLSEFIGLRWPVAGGAALVLAAFLWALPRRHRIAAALETEAPAPG